MTLGHTRDEVYHATHEYFSSDELATEVFFKYCLQDDDAYYELTPDNMHSRLAHEFHRIEAKYKNPVPEARIFEALKNFDQIVPQGSPMFGIGNDYQAVSLSNCVVVDSPRDSIEGIFETGQELAQLYKRRCGVGVDISTLRPEETPVRNAAKTSSGAWSFADFYSYITRMIGQSGRRGALMITMDIRHPDVEKFVDMKRDLTRVTGANVSVKLVDAFMEAVEADEEWVLQWPIDAEDPQVTRVIKARELWGKIIKAATETAEPGLIFWDTSTLYLPAHEYEQFRSVCVNPCVTEDTWIATTNGPKQVSELIDCEYVASVNGIPAPSSGFWKTGTKSVYELTTDRGYKVKLTEKHQVKTPEGFVELKDLNSGDFICISNQREANDWPGPGTYEEGWLVGEVVGDGGFSSNNGAYVEFWGSNQTEMANIAENYLRQISENQNYSLRSDFCGGSYNKHGGRTRVKTAFLAEICEKYLEVNTKKIKVSAEKTSADFCRGFLRGFFDADGSVQGNLKKGVSIRLGQANLERLEAVQRMLHRLGIASNIYTNRRPAGPHLLPDGKNGLKEYYTKALHELVISRDNVPLFVDLIGFHDEQKAERAHTIRSNRKRLPYAEKWLARVSNIEYIGEEDVYDCTVASFHEFDGNGIRLHNCSELILSAYDSCRLISLNLKNFVNNPFEAEAEFDYEYLTEVVRLATRLSDDLVDLELEKIQGIVDLVGDGSEKELWQKLYQACNDGRRIGLGTHGLADALSRLGLAYDSAEAIEIVDNIYSTIKVTAYEESVELAIERGAFPAFDWETEKDNLFIKSLPRWLQRKIAEHGRRNISLLTNAPTGSVSIVSQVSSGIEPVFRNWYTRRRKLTQGETGEADYVDELGDRWREYRVIHHNVQEYMEKFGLDSVEDLPAFFVTSDQIDWHRRIELQATAGKHLDHSISSTINLPKGTPPSVVGELYMEAWKQKLKGVTVYVDGSRSGVLLASQDTENFVPWKPPKRPEILPCGVHHTSVRGEKWVVLVGLMDGYPYEVFAGREDQIELPRKYDRGFIRKARVGRGGKGKRYDLHFDDDGVIKNIVGTFNNPNNAMLTRLISMSLRQGSDVAFVVQQLQKDSESDMFSFNRIVARILKRYIKDGTRAKSTSLLSHCPRDGNECDLVFQEGCVVCRACGASECG